MLFDHFHKGVCRNAPHTVQIVEKTGWWLENCMWCIDVSITLKRKQSDKERMLKLQTVFLQGFNSGLGDYLSKEDTH